MTGGFDPFPKYYQPWLLWADLHNEIIDAQNNSIHNEGPGEDILGQLGVFGQQGEVFGQPGGFFEQPGGFFGQLGGCFWATVWFFFSILGNQVGGSMCHL